MTTPTTYQRAYKPQELKKLRKDHPDIDDRTIRQVFADLRSLRRSGDVAKRSTPRVSATSQLLVEIAPVDLHVGKLAWGEETGGSDWDGNIAETVYTQTITRLIERAQAHGGIERWAYPVGNDLLQTDNDLGTTTSGTQVDTDSRYIKSFRRAVSLARWTIDTMSHIAPVTVPIVPGNHDRLTAFHVGDVLAAYYHNDKRVTIDNSPTLRKRLKYGATLLGWTHGSEEKQADLPLIMATEWPREWAMTTHHEWHVAHLHKSRETRYTAGDSFNGCRVKVLPSLCAPDAWHAQHGYIGEPRACEMYLWHRSEGYYGHLSQGAIL